MSRGHQPKAGREGEESGFFKVRKKNWARLIRKGEKRAGAASNVRNGRAPAGGWSTMRAAQRPNASSVRTGGWLADPELCPRCGNRMRVLAAISSPAQDEIIEKILRAKNQWDPPWKKTRPPRGPPPQTSPPATETSSRHWVPDEEYFNRDFPDD